MAKLSLIHPKHSKMKTWSFTILFITKSWSALMCWHACIQYIQHTMFFHSIQSVPKVYTSLFNLILVFSPLFLLAVGGKTILKGECDSILSDSLTTELLIKSQLLIKQKLERSNDYQGQDMWHRSSVIRSLNIFLKAQGVSNLDWRSDVGGRMCLTFPLQAFPE